MVNSTVKLKSRIKMTPLTVFLSLSVQLFVSPIQHIYLKIDPAKYLLTPSRADALLCQIH